MPVGQDLLERAIGQGLPDHEFGQHGEALAGEQSRLEHIAIIAAQPAVNGNGEIALGGVA